MLPFIKNFMSEAEGTAHGRALVVTLSELEQECSLEFDVQQWKKSITINYGR